MPTAGGNMRQPCYLTKLMVNLHSPRGVSAFVALAALAGCAGGGDRYPDLNLRDFERVQGTFSSAAPDSEPREPSRLTATTLAELESVMAAAEEQHRRFLAEARQARPIVNSASGRGIDDNLWPIAQVEIAGLESRNGETMSLLADLDSLYSDATFDFADRARIDAAREQVSQYHAAERQVISELVARLGATQAR